MTLRHPLSQRFHDLLREIGTLHDQKQEDYGRENDPFANVRSTAEWGQPAWVGAMIRATDKLRRLQKVANGGKLSNEGARDSFLDLAVYALIGLVLYDEQTKPKVDPPALVEPQFDVRYQCPDCKQTSFAPLTPCGRRYREDDDARGNK